MRELISAPNTLLRQPCQPVATVDSSVLDLISDMIRFLEDLNTPVPRAYGVAAPQFGELIQLFVINYPAVTFVGINPVIVKTHGQHNSIESCLSLPGAYYMVRRPKLIKFHYIDQNGEQRAGKFHDDLANVCEHEIQHLSGKMIDETGSPISRELIYR